MRLLPAKIRCHAAAVAMVCVSLGACTTVNPHQTVPAMDTAERWHTAVPHRGSALQMQEWWAQFQDVTLAQLIQRAELDSPSLEQAWAAIEKSRAAIVTARAQTLPEVHGNTAVGHARSTVGASAATSRSMGLDATWELDLAGKLGHAQDAALARFGARVDDWHDARISLAAEVADLYVQYRSCQLLVQSYAQALISKQKTLVATESAVKVGFTAPADSALTQASLASTQATHVQQVGECAAQLKSLVALTGMDEQALHQLLHSQAPSLHQPSLLVVPSLPAHMLQQRPDIAALEREAAAAGAEVGVARADLYPSLSLLGSIALSANTVTPSGTTWSWGPTLSLPFFDGGKRRAAVSVALANYDAAMAQWRQGVRMAIKEVEQALAHLDAAQKRSVYQGSAADQYARYLQAAEDDWRAGRINLLVLEEARRSALSAQVLYVEAQQDRLRNGIALYKSLGGGWEAGMAAVEHPVARNSESESL